MDACFTDRGRRSWHGDSPVRPRRSRTLNELMRLMMKSALERMLNTEMDVHLGRQTAGRCRRASRRRPRRLPTEPPHRRRRSRPRRPPNRRNGRSKKTVQGDLGEVTIATPRDRDGTFEPQLIGKHQRRVPGFDEKILALYAKGMTTRDIQEIVQRAVRRGGFGHADLGNHRGSRRRSDGLADAAAASRCGRSCTSTASSCMCAAPTAASRNTRFTWLWA